MPKETNQWVDAIARLTALTHESSLQWSVDSNPQGSEVVGTTYRTQYKGRHLRLQRRRVTFGFLSENHYFLEFVDISDNILWEFPEADVLEHLYNAVQYQTAGVKEFLDDLLSDE